MGVHSFPSIFHDQILAVWILAARLPNSDLNFAVDLGVDFSSCFFQGKGPTKSTKKIPPKNPRQNLFGKVPLGFLQKPSLAPKFLFYRWIGARHARRGAREWLLATLQQSPA